MISLADGQDSEESNSDIPPPPLFCLFVTKKCCQRQHAICFFLKKRNIGKPLPWGSQRAVVKQQYIDGDLRHKYAPIIQQLIAHDRDAPTAFFPSIL